MYYILCKSSEAEGYYAGFDNELFEPILSDKIGAKCWGYSDIAIKAAKNLYEELFHSYSVYVVDGRSNYCLWERFSIGGM